jgi:predicted ester cyclase
VVEDVLGEGDRVVIRFRMVGTHSGPLNMVRFQLPASGRAVDVEHIHVYRLAGGRIVEHWAGRDDGAFFRQLGLAPRPV